MSPFDNIGIDRLEVSLDNVIAMMKALDIQKLSLSKQNFPGEDGTIYAYEGDRVLIRKKRQIKVFPPTTEWNDEEKMQDDEKDPHFRDPRDSEISNIFSYLKPKVIEQLQEDLLRDHLNQFQD